MFRSYDILEHGMMVGDRRRMDAYLEAIRRAVGPGMIVVDIGSGTGVFAIAVCQAGARRVYAIEPGDVVHVARELVKANGYASRIELIQQMSTEVTLAERADAIILDVRSVLPDEQISVAADARRRFLKDGGTIIPSVDTLWAALVSAPALYDRHIGRWNDEASGLDIRPLRGAAANRWYKCRVEPEQLVGEPRRWAVVDYGAIDPANIREIVEWRVDAPVTVHGLVAWFDTVLHDDVKFSNCPGGPELLYGQGYFPWPSPVALRPGQHVVVELIGDAAGPTHHWAWNTRISSGPASAAPPVVFEQATTPRSLVAAEPGDREASCLTEAGQIDRLLLDMMFEEETLPAMAERMCSLFPAAFPRTADAESYVHRFVASYP